jgi:hypothetical protein
MQSTFTILIYLIHVATGGAVWSSDLICKFFVLSGGAMKAINQSSCNFMPHHKWIRTPWAQGSRLKAQGCCYSATKDTP